MYVSAVCFLRRFLVAKIQVVSLTYRHLDINRVALLEYLDGAIFTDFKFQNDMIWQLEARDL